MNNNYPDNTLTILNMHLKELTKVEQVILAWKMQYFTQ